MTKQNNKSDVDFIRALAALLDENDLTEIQVKREYGEADQINVRVSRVKQIVQAPVQMAAPVAAAAPLAAPVDALAAPATDNSDPAGHAGAVNSPMVGTVYLQAEPDSPSFVSIGDTVAEGDTLLIIEAMKTMNHIPAPHSGTVKRILVSDGDPVEFGAPLMTIE